MNIKLSIVIANYNNASYLTRCVESLYKSKANFNFEVVIIDDKSSDNSYEVIDTLEKKYDNLWSIRKEKNMTVGDTRNRAFYEVNGEYVLNFDADDYFINDFLYNISQLPSNWPDIISFNYFYEFWDAHETFTYKDLNDFKNKVEWQVVWNKIIKRSVVVDNNIKFYLTNMYDDISGMISIRHHVESFIHLDKSFAHYTYNKASLVQSMFTDTTINDMQNQTRELLKKVIIHVVEQNNYDEEIFEYAKRIYAKNIHYKFLIDGISEIGMTFDKKDYAWRPIRSVTFWGIWMLFNSKFVLHIVRVWNKLIRKNKIVQKYNILDKIK